MQAATIGHNQPPSFEEILAEKYAADLNAAAEIILDAEALPKLIDDPKQAEELTDFIKTANEAAKKLDAHHTVEKKVYLEGGRKVDKFFKGHIDCLEQIVKRAKAPLAAYMAKKGEEERQRLLKEEEEKRKAAEATAKQAAELAKAGLEAQAATAQEAADRQQSEANEAKRTANGSGLVKSVGGSGTAGIQKKWTGEIEDASKIDLNALRNCFSEDAVQKAINCFVAAGGRELAGVKIWHKPIVTVR